MYQLGTCMGSNLILFLLSCFLLKMVSVMDEPHLHKNNRHWFVKTNLELTEKICKNIFACLFSVHNTISLSRHEQVCS